MGATYSSWTRTFFLQMSSGSLPEFFVRAIRILAHLDLSVLPSLCKSLLRALVPPRGSWRCPSTLAALQLARVRPASRPSDGPRAHAHCGVRATRGCDRS